MNNHNDVTTREMRSEIGVSNFSFTLFRVHSVLIGCWTTVYEPVKALFDTTPQLSKEEFEKLSILGGDRAVQIEMNRLQMTKKRY